MTANDKIHQGRNIKRFREMLGLKQEALADKMGDDWTQKKVSLLEAKEEIDPATLLLVSKAMNLPKEAIENFRDESAVNFIASTFNDHAAGVMNHPILNFNPIDKIVELYEALVKSEREKTEMLQQLLKDK